MGSDIIVDLVKFGFCFSKVWHKAQVGGVLFDQQSRWGYHDQWLVLTTIFLLSTFPSDKSTKHSLKLAWGTAHKRISINPLFCQLIHNSTDLTYFTLSHYYFSLNLLRERGGAYSPTPGIFNFRPVEINSKFVVYEYEVSPLQLASSAA